jgi:hypothetical protein
MPRHKKKSATPQQPQPQLQQPQSQLQQPQSQPQQPQPQQQQPQQQQPQSQPQPQPQQPQPQQQSQPQQLVGLVCYQQTNQLVPISVVSVQSPDYAIVKEENTRLKQRVSELENHISNLNLIVFNKDKEIEFLRKENEELKIKIKQLEEKINNQDLRITEQNSKICEQDIKIAELCTKIQCQENDKYLSKLIVSIRDLETRYKLRNEIPSHRQALIDLTNDRVDNCHYLPDGLQNDIVNYRILILLDKLIKIPSDVKQRFEDDYGSGLIDGLIRFIKSLNLTKSVTLLPRYERTSMNWWNMS